MFDLLNPFTPSQIASQPNEFYGREKELRIIERSLNQGSIAIMGTIGIGKSSLLARSRLLMEGFQSLHNCKTICVVGNKDIQSVDQAARLVLEEFVSVDETSKKIKVNLGSIIEFEENEIFKYFVEGRHLSALQRILVAENQRLVADGIEYLIIAFDEADKCPIPLAHLVRTISTYAEQNGIKNIRFILVGVVPFLNNIIKEDPGISRFFYKTLTLKRMDPDDSDNLIRSKLREVEDDANKNKMKLEINYSDVTNCILRLSSCHPHLMQLLGSYCIEKEMEEPDEIIDIRNIIGSLKTICYQDRSYIYESMIHFLQINEMLEYFTTLIDAADNYFPTQISKKKAVDLVGVDILQWLIVNNFLESFDDYYGLTDEFLRIRLILDEDSSYSENDIITGATEDYFLNT